MNFAAAAALAAPPAPPLSPTHHERTYDPCPERTTPRRSAAEASALPQRPRQHHRHPSGASDVQLLRTPCSAVPERALGREHVSGAGCRATRQDGSCLQLAPYTASCIVPFPEHCPELWQVQGPAAPHVMHPPPGRAAAQPKLAETRSVSQLR